MTGEGEIVFGFILIIVFFITLTVATIPIIWTGALIGGIISIISGLAKMIKSATRPQSQPPKILSSQPITTPKQTTRCHQCGYNNPPDCEFCGKCGSRLGNANT